MKESRNHGLVSNNGKTKQRTMLSFRMDLAEDLSGDFRQNEKQKATDILPDLKPENGNWPRKMQKRLMQKTRPQKRAKFHYFSLQCCTCKTRISFTLP